MQKEEEKLTGFMSLPICCACCFPLRNIKKLMPGGGIGMVTAKVCVNENCMHYADMMNLSTWIDSSKQDDKNQENLRILF